MNTQPFTSVTTRLASMALAAVLTLVMLAGVDSLATVEAAPAMLAQQAAAVAPV